MRSELHYLLGPARESTQRWLDRGLSFLPMIRHRLARAHLPDDLCWLPMIESGFSNTAVSPKGAMGLWQLMPGTARMYGLRVDGLVDERCNPVKATRAALEYLSDLMDRFDSPYLAAAAYNAGSERVVRGLARLGDDVPLDPPDSVSLAEDDFFRLCDASLLAEETRTYVPRFIAASMIGRNPGRYGFHPLPEPVMPMDSVDVTKATSLAQIAQLAGVSPSELREMNPEFIRGVTPPDARSTVLIPRFLPGIVRQEIAELPAAVIPTGIELEPDVSSIARSAGHRGSWRSLRPQPRLKWVRARSGETLKDIAHRCGVSAAELSRVNRLAEKAVLPRWQVVALP